MESLSNLGNNTGAYFRICHILRITNDYKGQCGIEGKFIQTTKYLPLHRKRERRYLQAYLTQFGVGSLSESAELDKMSSISDEQQPHHNDVIDFPTHHRNKFNSRYRNSICPIVRFFRHSTIRLHHH